MTNLNSFMDGGIKNITGIAKNFYLGDLKGQAFIIKLIASVKKSSDLRKKHEKNETHIPPFLIASITSDCNLFCTGCYSRANGACSNINENSENKEMTGEEWSRIFKEASDIGVSFILLAGGEPFMRPEIIMEAANYKNMVFPIFTNGTLINEVHIEFFDKNRNMIPVLSIEGDAIRTDDRRGKGVADKVWEVAEQLKSRNILYGTSITVTSENRKKVLEQQFITGIKEMGCGLVFFVEYVPIEKGTENLMLSEDDLKELQHDLNLLRTDNKNKGIILLSFPGDEEAMGGCLAAGRGFFHINSGGEAEPCPFSPYSQMNLKENSLISVLKSRFFKDVREISAAGSESHKGGCTLFQYENEVKDIRLR